MKKLFFLFLISIVASPVFIAASINSLSEAQKSTKLISNKKAPGRPGVPPHVTIECYYGDGYIGFVFPVDVNAISVTVCNEIEEWSGLATVNEPVVETPSFSGEYEIECVADNGHTFVGIIEY